MDTVKNETIGTKMGMKKDILQEIGEHQLRWLGHVMRMEDCRIAKQVAECNPQGKRRCGRPVSAWKDGIRDSMQRRNLRMKNVSIESCGGKKICLWFEENGIHREIPVYI
jgi:hypothetical protein